MRPEPYDVTRERQMERQQEVAGKTCFFDTNPASVLLNGTPFCAVHAVCVGCGTPLLPDRKPVACGCTEYGVSGHEDKLWCSLEHMLDDHPFGEEREP